MIFVLHRSGGGKPGSAIDGPFQGQDNRIGEFSDVISPFVPFGRSQFEKRSFGDEQYRPYDATLLDPNVGQWVQRVVLPFTITMGFVYIAKALEV